MSEKKKKKTEEKDSKYDNFRVSRYAQESNLFHLSTSCRSTAQDAACNNAFRHASTSILFSNTPDFNLQVKKKQKKQNKIV